MKPSNVLPLAAAIGLASATHAVQAAPAAVDETMIVTANRVETPITDVLAPVSVITAADIEALQITNMNEVLSRMTGVDTTTSGGPGSNNSIYIRGGNTVHTLVLIDGVRVNSATLGQTQIELLDLSNVERVELVRGPASALYGADAVAGVLQVFTKKQQADTLTLKAEFGSQEWSRTGFRAGFGNDDTHLTLGATHEAMNGFDRRETDTFGNDDDDNYRNTQFNASFTHNWTQNHTFRATYMLNEGHSEIDSICRNGSFAQVACLPFADTRQEVLNLEELWQVNDSLRLQAQIARTIDETDNGDDLVTGEEVSGSDSAFETTKDTYAVQAHWNLNEKVALTAGGEYYNDEVESTNAYLDDERDNVAWFVQGQFDLGNHNIQLGLRNDDNEAYGSHTTQTLAWGYRLNDQLRLIASWGTAFRAPTFNDLYWPENPFGVGNPDLDPEESENSELALKFAQGPHRANLAVYRNRVDGMINWAPVIPFDFGGQWTPSNLDDVLVEGFEVDYAFSQGAWSASVNYAWTDAVDLAIDDPLPNRPRKTFNADIDYGFGNWQLGAGLRLRGDRTTRDWQTPTLPGFGVLDLRANYRFSETLRIDASLTNVLDKEYTQHVGYNEQGRGFKVGVSYSL